MLSRVPGSPSSASFLASRFDTNEMAINVSIISSFRRQFIHLVACILSTSCLGEFRSPLTLFGKMRGSLNETVKSFLPVPHN